MMKTMNQKPTWANIAKYMGFLPSRGLWANIENEDYFKKILETPKIKTASGKAVYLLLCASKIPLRFSQIQEILNLSKATTYRSLMECKKLDLINKKKRTEQIRTKNGSAPLTTVGWWPKGRKTAYEKLFNIQTKFTEDIEGQL